MTGQNHKLGVGLMVLTMAVFAAQDGISRHLASEYNVIMIVMIRYWFFVCFILAISARHKGGLRRVARTKQPLLQISRGILLVAEICVMVAAFTYLGLVESLAVFGAYPLLVAALSGPVLGEKVGPIRWIAICIGFVGLWIILQPGAGLFSIYSLIPVCSALMFALYALLTRYAARQDDAMTSFFWTGAAGAVAITIFGVWTWEPMSGSDWQLMVILGCTGALGHWMMIKAYALAEASILQPFAYLHLVFGSAVGVLIFFEPISTNVAIGASVVVGAGLFTIWRERQKKAV